MVNPFLSTEDRDQVSLRNLFLQGKTNGMVQLGIKQLADCRYARIVTLPFQISQNDCSCAFSALTLLVGRQEGHLACKKLSCGLLAWLSVGARCRLAYGPADAIATHCLLLQQNPDWFSPFW